MDDKMQTGPAEQKAKDRANSTVVISCLVFVSAMVGMAYAAVPLYDMFCRVTGYNGTIKRVEQASSVILDRNITVTFDANTSGGLPWSFEPVNRKIDVRIGETVEVMYRATNKASTPTTGQAAYNVTPMNAGAYFNKVQCFCFTETTLQPGEVMEMPVVFFVDPDLVKNAETSGIGTITLSYTFYPREPSKPVAALKDTAADDKRL